MRLEVVGLLLASAVVLKGCGTFTASSGQGGPVADPEPAGLELADGVTPAAVAALGGQVARVYLGARYEQPLAVSTSPSGAVWLVSSKLDQIRYTDLLGNESSVIVSLSSSKGRSHDGIYSYWPLEPASGYSPAIFESQDESFSQWQAGVHVWMVEFDPDLPSSSWNAFEIKSDRLLPLGTAEGRLCGFLLLGDDTRFVGLDGRLLWRQEEPFQPFGPTYLGIGPWSAAPLTAVMGVSKETEPYVIQYVGGEDVIRRTPAASGFRQSASALVFVHPVGDELRLLWVDDSPDYGLELIRLYSVDGEVLASARLDGGRTFFVALLSDPSTEFRYALVRDDGLAVLSGDLSLADKHRQPMPGDAGLLSTTGPDFYWWLDGGEGREVWVWKPAPSPHDSRQTR